MQYACCFRFSAMIVFVCVFSMATWQCPAFSAASITDLRGSSSGSGIPSASASAPRLPSAQGTGQMERGPQPLPGVQWNDSRPSIGGPAWAQRATMTSPDPFPPFGANLFQGFFAGTYYEGMNANYTVMPGDRLLVHIWGAQTYSDILMVDQQGNVFLPEIGPVQVAGMRNVDLQTNIRRFLASSFKSNVEVYVNLLTTQPVAVYVTGFVARPGRYAGGMNDSVLYYLDRAGGIIPERGTYRGIQVQRNNRNIATVDLYSFILQGNISGGQLLDGDVIVVGPKGDSIFAAGLIPQQASFESKGKIFAGSELIRLAAPLPAASHVSVTGTRGAVPFHVYLTLQDFTKFHLAAQDRVDFLADKPGDTIMVLVSGSTLGATRYPIKRNTTLRTLLAHVPVHDTLANLPGIYVKRKSVVEQQRKAINDALHRLESAVLTTSSPTVEIAATRVQEAQLVQNFAERVGMLEPDGIVVVTRGGNTSDIILEDGDEVVIPQRSDVVQISGEVMIPKAIVYEKGMNVETYVRNAGGFTDRADSDNILVVHPNGEIAQANSTPIGGGDLLLVLPRYDGKGFQIFKDIVQVLYQVAIATKVVVSL